MLHKVKSRLAVSFQVPKHLFAVSPLFGWAAFGSFTVTGVCAVIIFTLKLIGSLLITNVYVDPLATYDAILPGMPMAALASFPCNYQTQAANIQFTPERMTCQMALQDTLFDTIHVEIGSGYITAINFYSTDLQVGQIALHWQPTQAIQYRNGTMKWESGDYTIIVRGERLWYDDRPNHIQITANPQ